MEDCLKTQLKSEVQNSKLPVFDEFVVEGTWANSQCLLSDGTTTIRVIAGNPTVDGNPLVDGPTPTSLINLGVGGKVGIKPKSQMTAYIEQNIVGTLEDFRYAVNLKVLGISRRASALPLSGLHLETFFLYDWVTDLYAGLAGSKSTLTELRVYYYANEYFVLDNLVQFENLEKFYFTDFVLPFTIEDYVSACREYGRTSSTNTIKFYGKGISFNGNVLSDSNIAADVTWTSTTITCNGVTINA